MKDRIIRIMQEEKMNASQFSEAIGIQRAAMSHILAGRNNPSLDMVKKILTKFASISPDWLLSGVGAMRRTPENSNARYDLFSQSSQPDTIPQTYDPQIPKPGTRDVRTHGGNLRTDPIHVGNPPNAGDIHTEMKFTDVNIENSGHISKQEPKEIVKETIIYKEQPEKTIDKLLIFYSDNTFESFIPEKRNDSRK
ncbi:MAG: helix-turn-helix domain-containing protein [Tannerella sp.]|jgi:transcriptional regulator with XRE-family HTH domain|nr:helix-turn-helix domain-containing protein [Tannerella sp.]